MEFLGLLLGVGIIAYFAGGALGSATSSTAAGLSAAQQNKLAKRASAVEQQRRALADTKVK